MNSKYLNDIVRYLFILFRFVFILSLSILCITLFYYVIKYAYPFLIAFLAALLINPLVNFLEEKWHLKRGLATLLALLIILATFCSMAVLLVIEMINGIAELTAVVPQNIQWLSMDLQHIFTKHIMPLWERLTHMVNTLNEGQQKTIQANIQEIGQRLAEWLSLLGQSIVKTLTNIVLSIPSLLTILVFILMGTFFINKDWYKMLRFFKHKIPLDFQKSTEAIFHELRRSLQGYIRAQFILMTLTGLTVFFGLSLLRVQHALTISVFAMLIDIMPYLGTGTLLIPWGLYTYLTQDYFLTIGIASLYAITIIQRQLLEPKLVSSSIGSNPLMTLVALFIGFKLFGIMGLVLGPICLIALTAFFHSGIFVDLFHFITGKNRP
ncbi:sporulation integral membrane protein YtvI [Pullulanibacillus camelliae]|uniref:Sporulation integral membrane protein YtvI n=1 Tax=Pullulanibacillus camelliae TaxID=1707096 RepID=A0A8J2YLK8_9BACL|nr:sporulation integral membrane protein YtvI [Pullulanibacillus camelliae]GGE51999.1 sporulation integral membrane protein YtvI [Pullulanibacillus camelliae]